VKLDHTYILPSIFALIVHVVVAFIVMSEWQSSSQRIPPVQVKQRVEATLIDLDSLLAQQKLVDSAAIKKAAAKKAAAKKAAAKKAADKKAADKKAADKKAADKKTADKKAADKKAADKKAADKRAADKRADKKLADQKAADKKAAQELAKVEQALESLLDEEEAQADALEQQITNGQAVGSAVNYIRDEIGVKWVRPANARNGMVVELIIYLVPTGEVVNVEVSYRDPSATDAFVSSVVKAIKKVRRFDKLSQLNSVLFDANFRQFTVKFKPEDLRL
jgi:colicin import membrane protein